MVNCFAVYARQYWTELATQLVSFFDYDDKRIESILSTKHLDISINDIMIGLAKIGNDRDHKLICSFALMRGICTAISNLVPIECEDEEKKTRGEVLKKEMGDYASKFGQIVDLLNDSVKRGEDISFLYDLYADLSVFVHMFFFLYLCAYQLFCGPKEGDDQSKDILNAINQMCAMLSMCNQKVEHIANETQQANSNINIIKKQTEQTVKDSKQISDKLEDIQRKQTVSDATIKRRFNKTIETVEKRNKKESRCELTQMDCARIIAEERKINYEAKKSLLVALKMSTESIDKDKNPDEENIARTIVRWDTGETKPPVGYSRRISEYEFREWVKKREKKKLDNWIVKIRKSLKTIQAELVPEAVLDEWMRLTSGNDNDPYSKIKA